MGRTALLLCALTIPAWASGQSAEGSTASPALSDFLNVKLGEHEIPAMSVLVWRSGEVVDHVTVGERKHRSGIRVTQDDLWHIGSNGKAFTAALVGRLIAGDRLVAETTLVQVFGKVMPSIDEAAGEITIHQLLTHTSGLPANDVDLYAEVDRSGSPPRQQRAAFAKAFLRNPPEPNPNNRALYSNAGYIILGAIAERVTGISWEEALAREVLRPLGITTVGFGAPRGKDLLSQPWGHQPIDAGLNPMAPDQKGSDNPAVLRPAGGIHLSIADWSKFAIDQVRGSQGEGVLYSEELYRFLQRPVAEQGMPYASGWVATRYEDDSVRSLWHSGSNGFWYTQALLAPRQNLVMLVAINCGGRRAVQTISEIRGRIGKMYGFPDPLHRD